MNQMSTPLNDEHWLNLITQCRSSGLTDRQWCIENGIPVSTFYYHVRALRKKACEVPEAVDAAAVKIAVLAHTARSTRAILPKQESHLAGWLD